ARYPTVLHAFPPRRASDLRVHTAAPAALDADAMLARIQNDLFDLGADLSTPHEPPPKHAALRIAQGQVDRLEREIDAMNDKLAPGRKSTRLHSSHVKITSA